DNLREHRELVAEQEVRHQEVHQKFEAMLNNVTMQYETLVNFTDQRSRLDRRAAVLYDNLLRTESRLSHVTDSWRSGYIHRDIFRLFPNMTMTDAPYQLWTPHICERDAKGRYALKFRAKRVIKSQDVISVE